MPIIRDKFAATTRVDQLAAVRLGCHCPHFDHFPAFLASVGVLSRCSEEQALHEVSGRFRFE